MKRIVNAGLAMIALAGVASTAEAEVFKYRTRGHSADFSTYTESECGYGAVSVYAFESLEKTNGGGGTAFEGAYIDYYDYDFCTGESSYGFAFLDGASVEINRLQSASVDVASQMTVIRYSYDGGGDSDGGVGASYEEVVVPLTVILDWTGTGEATRSQYVSSWSGPSGHSRYRSNGSYRQASVSGSVDIGDVSFDVSAGYGSLSQSNSGSFEMYR